jgi:hypothetical protein
MSSLGFDSYPVTHHPISFKVMVPSSGYSRPLETFYDDDILPFFQLPVIFL